MHDCFITYRDGSFGRFTIPDTATLESLVQAARDGELHAYEFTDDTVGGVKVVIRGQDIRSIVTTERGTVYLEGSQISTPRLSVFDRIRRRFA